MGDMKEGAEMMRGISELIKRTAIPIIFCFSTLLYTILLVALPLATYADEDDEDGDHEGGGRCDGSQEQEVFVGFHDPKCCLACSCTLSQAANESLRSGKAAKRQEKKKKRKRFQHACDMW